MHVVPIDFRPTASERLDQRRKAFVARIKIAKQQLVIDRAVALGLCNGQAERGIVGETHAVIVGLDFAVALSVGEAGDVLHSRQETAFRAAGREVGIDDFGEMIFVALCVVHARLGVAAAHAGEGLAVLALGFATHGVGHAGRGDEIADVGRIDEHPATIGFSAEGGDRGDAPPGHGHALAGRAVEMFTVGNRHAGIGEHFFKNPETDVRLETADEFFAVSGGDRVVKFRGDAAERVALAEEITGAESAGTHAAGEGGRVDENDRAALAPGGDRGGDGTGRVPVNDEVVNGGLGRQCGCLGGAHGGDCSRQQK